MENLVKMIDGKAVTTSRKVAEVFEKQHKNILQAIREMEIPEDFRELNFQPSEYEVINSLNKTIKYPEYLITKDGFTLLAMGFTGKKAMQFKIAYIEAFNAMEAALQEPVTVTAPNLPESTAELLHSINKRLLAGDEVDKEVLRYAWNVGKMFEKAIRRNCSVRRDDDIAEFICNLPQGEYTRAEIFEMYKQSTGKPASPRWFWEHARTARDFRERRSASTRYVIIED
jgi:Rha family phage regulatory protein